MQMRSLGRAELPTTMLGVLPFFHSMFGYLFHCFDLTLSVTGLVQILQLPIALNQVVVIMPKFEMQSMLDVIMKYKCDELWMVPRKF